MAIRLSGMASGLDTDSIVQALVSSYSYKKSKYEKAQTKLGWTQEAWKSLNTKVYSLYSNVSNLRFSTAYSLKKTSVSDSTKASVKAGSSAPNGTQTLKITNTAKAGYLTGEGINASSSSTTLAQLGYTGGDAKINVNTKDGTKSITLSATSTMSDVEKQLKEAGLNASYDSTYKRFYISAKDTGADNDFTLTGANTGGATALYKLGIAVGTSTSNPYSQYDSLYGGSDAATQQKIENAVAAYKSSSSNIEKYTAQSNNLLNAITYGTAYADVQDFYRSLSGTKTESGADIDTAKLETLAKLGSGRDSAIITKNSDGTYTTYSKTTAKDADGNTVYKSEDGKYISAEERYTNGGKTYKKNSDGAYVNVSDENDKYSGDTADLTKTVTYKNVSESKSYVSGSDADTKTYTKNSDDTYTCDGKTYTKRADGKYYAEGEAADSKNGVTITEKVEYTSSTAISDAEAAADAYKDITKNIDEKALSTYSSNLSTVTAFESTKDTSLTSSDEYTIAGLTSAIHNAYDNGGKDAVSNLIAGNGTDSNAYAAKVAALTTSISSEQTNLDNNKLVKELAAIKDTTSSEYQTALKNMVETVNSAHDLSSNAQYNTKAKKVEGEDAEIWLNGVQYTGSSSTFTINNLTIEALATTGNDEISITTSTDTQGIYDKVKDLKGGSGVDFRDEAVRHRVTPFPRDRHEKRVDRLPAGERDEDGFSIGHAVKGFEIVKGGVSDHPDPALYKFISQAVIPRRVPVKRHEDRFPREILKRHARFLREAVGARHRDFKPDRRHRDQVHTVKPDQRIARPIDKVKLFPEFPDLSEDPVSVILKRHDPEFPPGEAVRHRVPEGKEGFAGIED